MRLWVLGGCAALAACMATLPGCTRAMVSDSAVRAYPLQDQELDYLDALEAQTSVCNDDALHGFLLLVLREDPATDYEGRVKVAVERKWLPEGFDRPALESASVGWMARAACIEGRVKGGLTMRVIGPLPRYATRELVFRGVLPPRSENQSLSGREFIDFLNRLDRIGQLERPSVSPKPPMGEGPAAGQAAPATPEPEAPPPGGA